MRVLVTGSAGFIGSALCAALRLAGHDVAGMDKRGGWSTVDAVGCMGDYERPDVIAHLAGQCSTVLSVADPVHDYRDNALGTVGVAEAAHRWGNVPIVFTSTVKVHDGRDRKRAPLGLSKSAAEDVLRFYRSRGVRSVVVRPSTVYGPGQVPAPHVGWVAWLTRCALTGQPLRATGDGRQTRRVLFVDDMVALLVDLVEQFDAYEKASMDGTPFGCNGGRANEISVNDLLSALIPHMGGTAVVEYVPPLVGDLWRDVGDNGELTRVNGWEPAVGWRDGLERTVAWQKASFR